jgi:hypothetical protein
MERIIVSSPLTKTVALQSAVATVQTLASAATTQLSVASLTHKSVSLSSKLDIEES